MLAFVLTVAVLLAEAVGGLVSGSLALLADAGHMLIDALALLFAWFGAHYARKPADARRSFGYARLEVLVGYSNALAQFVLVVWIAAEAAMRFARPGEILSGVMLAVAVGGLVVNAFVLGMLGGGHDHDDLNTASARLHVLGDLLGSLGAVGAALVVRYFGWHWADPAASIFVSLLILVSAWRLLRRSAHILLEGVPEDVKLDALSAAVAAESGVVDVHHVHVWQLAGGHRVATLHARLAADVTPADGIRAVSRVLRERFAIDHVTVQLDDGTGCAASLCGERLHTH